MIWDHFTQNSLQFFFLTSLEKYKGIPFKFDLSSFYKEFPWKLFSDLLDQNTRDLPLNLIWVHFTSNSKANLSTSKSPVNLFENIENFSFSKKKFLTSLKNTREFPLNLIWVPFRKNSHGCNLFLQRNPL